MAWALLCALVVWTEAVATAKPPSFDRAVDVEVAWDFVDLPFTVNEQLLSKKSALLLQDWHSDDDFGFGTPLDKELQDLHARFTSILTSADAANDAAATKKPHLRSAVHRSEPLASHAASVLRSLGWSSPHLLGGAPEAAAFAGGSRDTDDEDSQAVRAAKFTADLSPSTSLAADVKSDHEDSGSWDLATGQRRARPTAPSDDSENPFLRNGGAGSNIWKDFEARYGNVGSSDATGATSSHSSSPRSSPVASPKRSGDRKKPLLWMHVHKAGGSFMCQMAKRNERVVAPEENCNWKGHDGYQQSGQAYTRVSCDERAKAFHRRGFTYGQVEREMDSNEVCDEFRYGVMLREPMSLMHSLLNYEIWYTQKFAHHNLNIPPDMVDWLKGKINDQTVPGDQFAPWVHLDNFQTRVIANAFDVPAGQISDEHVEKARSFLQNNGFMVHILEDLPTQGESLFNELGWKWQAGALHRKVNQLAMEERPFMPEEKQYLKELNKYDYALYNGMRSSE